MTDMCTDGRTAYISFAQSAGTSAIYTSTGTAFTSAYTLAGSNIEAIGFAKGRLLVGSSDGTLRNPTATGALPAALITLSGGSWLGFAEGNGHIYAAARISTGSWSQYFRIYRTAVKPDGTALDVPVVAATLPNNEQLLGMYGYLGFIALLVVYADPTLIGGTYRMGVRLCEPNSAGDLVMGPLVPVGRLASSSSLEYWGNGAFAAEGRFLLVCAGRNAGFSPATIYGAAGAGESFFGIARLDLSTFVAELAPAVSFDVGRRRNDISFAGNDYTPCAVIRWQDYNCFLLPTIGLYRSNSTTTFGGGVLVPSGDVWLGEINYDLTDRKTAMYIDVLLDPQDTYSGGSVEVYASTDGVWPATLLGTVANTDAQPKRSR